MNLNKENIALLLIDIQKGFEDETYWGGNRNNKNAEINCSIILKKWRELKLPLFHIIHSSDNPASKLHESHPGFEIHDLVKPLANEPVIIKRVNSAFIGTNLEELLKNKGISQLVIVGLTTNHCISTSTRMSGNLGFDTILVADATATFDRKGLNGEVFPSELIHQTTLASLNKEFAEVINTQELINTLNAL